MNMRRLCLFLALACLALPAMAAVQYDGDVRIVKIKLVTDEEFKQFHLDGENYAKSVLTSASEVLEKVGKVRLVIADAGTWKSPDEAEGIFVMVSALQEQVSLGNTDMVIGFLAQPPGAREIALRRVEGGIASIFERYALIREPQGGKECFVESVIHEIGHAFGLQHVKDDGSFMRPATSPNPIFTLDQVNTDVLQITRTVDLAKGMDDVSDEKLDKLTALYQKLASAFPEGDGPPYALSLISKRKLDEALAKAKAAVEKSPDDVSARRNLAGLSLQAGDYAGSESGYREITRKLPDDADARNGLGLALLHQGKVQQAAQELQEAARLKPDDAAVHVNLADALRAMGQFDRAISEYREALRISPDVFEAHANLASILGRQGKMDEAAQEYQKAISINPNQGAVRCDYGVVLLSMGRLEEATQEFQAAIRLDPDLSAAHNNLALIFRSQGKIEEAMLHFREAIRSAPGNVSARLDLGMLLMNAGKLNEAAKEFKSGLAASPESPAAADLHNSLGIVFAMQGKMEEAMQEFREAIRLRPDFPIAHNGLGIIYAQRGQIDDAMKEFQEAIRIKPDFAQSHGGLAMAYYTKKQYADAWKEAHLCLKYGGKLDPEFRKALTEEMPEPSEQ